jgi:hypothetical protein
MALTIGGKDFERASATGMMKSTGVYMQCTIARRSTA